jgi:CHAD domain-containing protein
MVKRKPEESIRIYTAGLILQQLDALASELHGVKSARDIEYIHRMRVSSRRLRAIMEVFQDCLPVKRGIVWQEGVKNVTQALGAARDTDVQIDSITTIFKNLPDPAMRPGIRRLILRLKQRRARLQIRVMEKVNEFETSGLQEEMRAAFIVHAARNSEVYLYTPELYKRSFERIHEAFQVFSSYEKDILDPANIKELHAMRIAGKNFRYILECFTSIYSNALKNPISIMKNAQDLLGNIHDCDIWALELPRFLEEEHKRSVAYLGKDRYGERYKIGIQYLIDFKKQNRDLYYQTFIQQWELWKAENVWEDLMQTLQVPFFQDRDITPLPLIKQFHAGGPQ